MRLAFRPRRSLYKTILFFIIFIVVARGLNWLRIAILPKVTSALWYKMETMSLVPCGFAKFPFVQLLGTDSAMLMWETNCRFDALQITYRRRTAYRSGPKQQLIPDHVKDEEIGPDSMDIFLAGHDRYIYRVFLQKLITDSLYDYTIRLVPEEPTEGKQGQKKVRITGEIAPFRETFYFPGDKVETVSLGIISDTHGGIATNVLMRNLARRKPDLVVHLGDMVNRGWNRYEWQTFFFDTWNRAGISSRIPSLLLLGNHDVAANGIVEYVAPPSRLGNKRGAYYYALTIGPARFIVLDSNVEDDAQLAWLDAELSSMATQRCHFRVLLAHFPLFIEYWSNGDGWKREKYQWIELMRNKLLTLVEKYRIDLMLTGHQHNYQRGFRNGVHHVIAGGGGGILDRVQIKSFNVYKVTHLTHHYLQLTINPTEINLRAFDIGNRLIDHLVIPRNVIRRFRAPDQ